MSRSKYGAKKTLCDGFTFDSAAEAARWMELVKMEMRGEIKFLHRQIVFVLAPKVKISGELRARPAIRYVADFTYRQNHKDVVEDVKSPVTARLPAFRLKQHLMATVHGLEIRITS